MRSLTVLALSLAVLTAGRAHAEPVGRAVTLDEALAQARAHDRDVLATREHLNQVKTDIDRAWVPLLPQITLQGKYTLNNKEIDLAVTPTPTPGSFAELSQKAQADVIRDLAPLASPASQAELVQVATFCANGMHGSDPQCICQNNPTDPSCLVVIQQLNQLDFFINLSIPIVVPWAWYSLRAAKENYGAQRANADSTVAQLMVQVAASYFAAAGNDELVTARAHGVTVARETLDNAKARVEAGVSNRVDVTRAEQALVKAEQSLEDARASEASSYRVLATLIQLRDQFHVVGGAEPPVADETPRLVADGLRLRPELRAMSLQIASASANVMSAKLRWVPSLSGFGLFRAFSAPGFAGDHWAWALGVQLDWQLNDPGLPTRPGQLRLARSAERETRLRTAQLRDQISDEVATARDTLEVKRSAVNAARREVALADETLHLVRVQRDAGTVTQLDLLQAQDALIQAEVAMARARFDLGLAWVQLQRAAGLFPGAY